MIGVLELWMEQTLAATSWWLELVDRSMSPQDWATVTELTGLALGAGITTTSGSTQ